LGQNELPYTRRECTDPILVRSTLGALSSGPKSDNPSNPVSRLVRRRVRESRPTPDFAWGVVNYFGGQLPIKSPIKNS
jgi:hypothetical protein